jgi:large subunit GTPase 1
MLRRLWADHFDKQGLQYAFFSAANATALQEARRQALAEVEAKEARAHGSSDDGNASEDEEDNIEEDEGDSDRGSENELESEDEGLYLSAEEESPNSQDPRARVLSVPELEDLFVKVAPDLSGGFVFGLTRRFIMSKIYVL